jgi:DNA-binding NarL/FixJ family response regulator
VRSLCLVVGNAIHRDSLTSALEEAGFAVTGTVASGGATLGAIRDAAADVILVDLPLFESLPLLRALRYQPERIRIVVIGQAGEEAALPRWLDEGVMGVVLATESLHDLVAAIETVAAGATRYPAPLLAPRLNGRGRLPPDLGRDSPWRRLTERELEIVRMIDRGCSNKEISVALGIQLSTVKNHVHHLLEKLHAPRRAAAAAQVAGRRQP